MWETHKATKRWKEHCDVISNNTCVVPAGPSPGPSGDVYEAGYTDTDTRSSNT